MFSQRDVKVLQRDGFLIEEIREYGELTFKDGKPQNVDVNSDFWKSMRKSRREFVAKCIKKGASNQQIEEAIKTIRIKLANDYNLDEDSFAGFLRLEYSKSFGVKPDYETARNNRTKDVKDKKRKKADAEAYERGRHKN